MPGPRSPKANGHSLPGTPATGKSSKSIRDAAGHQDDEEGDDSPSPSRPKVAGPTASSSKLIGPALPAHLASGTPTATPTRKGKEVASPSTTTSTPRTGGAAATRPLHEDPIDLTWPTHLRTRKHSSAGLINPSMACYANATLQVLLHTPPVLRIASSHDTEHCERPSDQCPCSSLTTSLIRSRSSSSDEKVVYVVRFEEDGTSRSLGQQEKLRSNSSPQLSQPYVLPRHNMASICKLMCDSNQEGVLEDPPGGYA